MIVPMKALLTDRQRTRLEDIPTPDLEAGEILLRSEYSSLNYKDALGVTGKGAIFKSFPLVGGIDVAGQVVQSRSNRFQEGDRVLITGCGLGETHNGGYAEFVKEHESAVVTIPPGLDSREAMIYGTAGFTACLALERMVQNGQAPEMGPILVTGASGGVGQFALHFFNARGFETIALTGKPELHHHLQNIGAQKVMAPEELDLSQKPLNKARYGGVVDNVGGRFLSALMAQVNLWGNVACIGLADNHELHASVMPFILRGVSLLGTSSNNTPRPLREKIWTSLAGPMKPTNMDVFLSDTIGLEEVENRAHEMLARKTHGRTLVKILP